MFSLRLAGLVVLAFGFPAMPVYAADDTATKSSCFYFNQMQNWRAVDSKTLNISVNGGRYYRLELSGACSAALWPSATMVRTIRGSSLICRPVDWDLKFSDTNGFFQSCIVKSMTLLTPEDVAAMPARVKP